jgi:hydroxyacylglutathione hydrolase
MINYEYCGHSSCFLQICLGGDRNFGYLCGDFQSGIAAAVDPGFGANLFMEAASDRKLAIKMILITHAHSDHIGQAEELAKLTEAPIYAGEQEAVSSAAVVRDGDRLLLGNCAVLALHTPGHSPGHFCFLFDAKLVTGDLLFCGKVGGTGSHFPGSSPEEEWRSLKRITGLPDETLVFPGHDYYGGEGDMPHSSLGYEKQHNPFLLCQDLNAFLHLKDTWAEYKRQHGIR